jgi:peptidoglycan/LPS O-acetylase OafA/YrhL
VNDATATKRLPSLDGLRAVSIGFVIVAHLASSGSAPLLRLLWRFDLGNLGVRVFFVISGFLITSILLHDEDRRGSIDLKNFYLRRLLRIGPAYFFFLAVVALAGAVDLVQVRAMDFVPAVTYTSNYFFPSFVLGHTWSLSVEEQFYLLWPGALLLLGRRRSFAIAIALVVVAPIIRFEATLHPEWLGNSRYSFPAVADALACGCLLAVLRNRQWAVTAYRRFASSKAVLLLPLAILSLQMAPQELKDLALYTITNVLIVITIDCVVRFPQSIAGRVLNLRPMMLIGTLSYSLYLWQQPFLDPANGLPLPLRLVGLVAAACASYWLVEKPMLQWRGRNLHQAESQASRSAVVTPAQARDPDASFIR